MANSLRQRLTWIAWGGLLLVVLAFGFEAVRLVSGVASLRSELEGNVELLMVLQDVSDDAEAAREQLTPVVKRLPSARLVRDGQLVLSGLDRPERSKLISAYVTGIRSENARISRALGAAWWRSTTLLFAAFVFAVGALVLGAFAVRSRERQDALTAALAKQEARAETADVLRILNLELTAARDDALGARRLRDQLLGTLGQELRVPLDTIRGYCERLPPSEETTHTLEAVQHLERRVQQILELSEEARPETLLSFELAELLAPLAERWGATLSGNAKVRTQARRLERALDEILANATHFADTVRMLVYVDNGVGVIEVSDDGPGMTPDSVRRATEAFWQDHTPTRGSRGGLGLGLAVADHHLRAIGGSLEIASTPGEGTTVTVRLDSDQPS